MFALYIQQEQSSLLNNQRALPSPKEKDVLWVSFDGELTQAQDWLGNQGNLDEHSVEALCDELTRPRLFINSQEDLVVTLRAIHLSENQERQMASVRAWITSHTLVSLSKYSLSVSSQLASKLSATSKGVSSPEHILWKLCDLIAEDVTTAVADMDEQLHNLEDRWESQHDLELRSLQSIRRDISHMQRFLSPQLETYQKLSNLMHEKASIKSEKRLYQNRWRETLNALKRDIEALNEMRDRVTILRDGQQQHSNETTNRIMLLLSVVSTFFLPLTFLASLLGMNVAGIPLSNSPQAFVWVCGLMLSIAIIQWVFFRRRQWLK